MQNIAILLTSNRKMTNVVSKTKYKKQYTATASTCVSNALLAREIFG